MIKKIVEELVKDALKELGTEYSFKVEVPPKEFGDFSTNAALVGAKFFKRPPREVAEDLAKILMERDAFEKVSIAGPGFINFRISNELYIKIVEKILNEEEAYGRAYIGKGKRIQFEYGSANPTGPLTVAHGRQVVIGDILVNVFKELGYDVKNEVYLNDAGKQITLLAKSLWVRYNEIFGKEYEIPEGGYKGEYLKDIAKELADEIGEKYVDKWDKETEEFFKKYALEKMKNWMKISFEKLGSTFDEFFSERSLIEDSTVEKVLNILREKNLIYKKDGAVWFKASEFVNDDDKVLIRSDGTPTYFMTDIAYHYNKKQRGFDRVYDIWGSDHQGHIPRMQAAMKALGFDENFLTVIIHQYVTLKKEGKILKMSTREGRFITLDDLLKQVGKDAVRYFYARIDPSTHLIFDIDLAVKKSMDNPVYYVQYAHARIASLFKQAESKGLKYEKLKHLHLLGNEDERDLIKRLSLFPDVLMDIHDSYISSKLTNYLEELAHDFHQFYTKNIIIDINNPELSSARLDLSKATAIVIRKGLRIIGVSAPERM